MAAAKKAFGSVMTAEMTAKSVRCVAAHSAMPAAPSSSSSNAWRDMPVVAHACHIWHGAPRVNFFM